MVLDSSGNVIVVGFSDAGINGSDWLIIKYSNAGVPLLTIARTTTNTVALSWPSPSSDFTLQQNTNVATTNWTPVGTIPTGDGATKTVVVNLPTGNRFYRLTQP